MARITRGRFAACTVAIATGVLGPAWSAPPAIASGHVSAGVAAGFRGAVVGRVVLTATEPSSSAFTHIADLAITVDDSSGSGAGWRLTVASAASSTSGRGGRSTNVIAGPDLLSASSPVTIAGQQVDGTSGPLVPRLGSLGTLDSPRMVLAAAPGYGQGTYVQHLVIAFTTSGHSPVGPYAVRLTTTISAGP